MPDIPKKQLKNILPKIFMFGIGLGIFSSAVYYLFVKWVRNYVKLKGMVNNVEIIWRNQKRVR